MKAPVYPPAAAFTQPEPVPFEFGVDTVVVDELISSPSIKAMLEREIPNFSRALQSPMLKPHLSNFTLRSMVDFGIITPDMIEAIDAKLRSWPIEKRPKL